MNSPSHPIRARVSRLRRGVAITAIGLAIGFNPAQAQESIDDARGQRDQTRLEELRARAAVDVLDAEFEDIQAAYDAADDLVSLVQARTTSVEAQLELTQIRLARSDMAIAWAEYDREKVDAELAALAVNRYLGVSANKSILEDADLNETLTRNAVLEVVQRAGSDVVDDARSAADRYEELKERAERDLEEVTRLEAQLETELEQLEEARDARASARDALADRRSEWTDRVAELEDEEQRLTDFIRTETQRAETQSALDAAQSTKGYVWPTAGGIGSYFGYRVHPVLGYSRLHGGLDIGGRMGQPIWAAKEGVVILAGVNGGYGNTIVIDHGNGIATLYAHQSSFEVAVGDTVETGEHIGNVGSTGLSTGPHLHFEVRIDGEVNDPLPYLPSR